MPIYEYISREHNGCNFCMNRFEIRQGVKDQPLQTCPECGSPVTKVFSRNFIAIMEPLSSGETFDTYSEEEADRFGLDGGFAPDQIYEDDF
ncbi:MAG: zinc ribbon domain-containing protein [Dehalococcoidia bacterium]